MTAGGTGGEPARVVPAVRPLNPRVAALGGGHGLFASLSALRRVTRQLTAIVTVADDGGSSGVLRREFGVLPPGDLRMALAALCGDDAWGTTWSKVVQHRFTGGAGLDGHAVGNVLIVALWELLGDTVQGLDWVGRLLGAHGRVLPMASVPIDLVAEVEGADPARPNEISTVYGQAECAATTGRVRSISLIPSDPPACPEAVAAIRAADWVVLGPGSWFTSVLPHLMVPELAQVLISTRARRLVALNLAPQPGETEGFSPAYPPGSARRSRASAYGRHRAGGQGRGGWHGRPAGEGGGAARRPAGTGGSGDAGRLAPARSAAAGGGVRRDLRGGVSRWP